MPTFNIEIPQAVEASHLRVSNTGHGWGQNNTGNAAEFYNATHYLDINGTQTFSQHLWNQCNPNPDGCTGQRGTWSYSRAGWCPGAIAHPDTYDMSAYIGNTIDVDYRFHPSYQDYCHPNNPNCITGQTCPDCNDGSNPIYYVDTHLINRSNNPMIYGNILGIKPVDNTQIYDVSIYPNPSKGVFQIKTQFPDSNTSVTVNTVDGKTVKTYYFKSNAQLNNYNFDITSLSAGIYFLNIQNSYGSGVKRIILE